MKLTVAFVFVASLLTVACGAETSNPTSSVSESDQATITAAVEKSEFFGSDLTDDDSPDGAQYTADEAVSDPTAEPAASASAGGTSCLPVAWGRGGIELKNRNIEISITGPVASVTVTHNISGILFVDTTDNGTKDPWTKPLEDTLTRRAEFLKEPAGWRLSKISPVDVSLTDPEQQTVRIERVQASVHGEIVWEADSSSQLFGVPEGLPTFSPGTEVLVEAQVSNTKNTGCDTDSFVFLHHPGPMGRERDPMFDDGTHGDQIVGDGIYSRTYTISPAFGRHFAAVDAISAETFADPDAPYNSTGWGMPYLVALTLPGTMEHLNIEGGCWRFTADDGTSYQPAGGGSDLYQDGLRVTITGIPRPLATLCQVGPILEVLKYTVNP